MQAGYFHTAWNDIKNSPGWFGKLCIFALLFVIPIVGPILGSLVLAGYAYGWARDIAWNIHAPMPARIFANEDGKLWSRGFFALLIGFIFALAPAIIGSIYTAVGTYSAISVLDPSNPIPAIAGAGVGGFLLSLVILVLSVFAVVFGWVGIMRMSIYGRLSPGLQIGKIWKMIRHDTGGLARIVGMVVLVSLVIGIVFSVVSLVLTLIVGGGAIFSLLGQGAFDDFMYYGSPYMDERDLMRLLGALGPSLTLFSILALAIGFFGVVSSSFITLLTARALGYWTRQFQVSQWRSQDEPMPFEYTGAAANAAAAAGMAEAQAYVYGGQHDYGQAQAAGAYQQAVGQAAAMAPGAMAAEVSPVADLATGAGFAAESGFTGAPAPIASEGYEGYAPDPMPSWVQDAQESVVLAEADQSVSKLGMPGEVALVAEEPPTAPDAVLAQDVLGAEAVEDLAGEEAPSPFEELKRIIAEEDAKVAAAASRVAAITDAVEALPQDEEEPASS